MDENQQLDIPWSAALAVAFAVALLLAPRLELLVAFLFVLVLSSSRTTSPPVYHEVHL